MRKKVTAKDVFEQIDLRKSGHKNQPWNYDAAWEFYATPCLFEESCREHLAGIPFLESIAESLSLDGTVVK